MFFLGSGGYIFYNTNILNDFYPPKHFEKESIEFEKSFKKYEGRIQPKITSVNCTIDLFPKEARLEFSGTYILKNKHNDPIDTIYTAHKDWMYDKYDWGRPTKIAFYDSTLGWKMYVFDPPIMPGDEFLLQFAGLQSQHP